MAKCSREALLAIGQQLRADYAAVKEPVPERLASLVEQLELDTDDPPAEGVQSKLRDKSEF